MDDEACFESFLKEQQCLAPLVVPEEWRNLANCLSKKNENNSGYHENKNFGTIDSSWVEKCGKEFEQMSVSYVNYWRKISNLPDKPTEIMEQVRKNEEKYDSLASLRQVYWLALRKSSSNIETEDSSKLNATQIESMLDMYGNMCKSFCYGNILCPGVLEKLNNCIKQTGSLEVGCENEWNALRQTVTKNQIAKITINGKTLEQYQNEISKHKFEYLDPSTRKRLITKLKLLK